MRYLLLLIPCVLAVLQPWYNFTEPQAFGIPFFYWLNLTLIPLSSLFIFLANQVGGDK